MMTWPLDTCLILVMPILRQWKGIEVRQMLIQKREDDEGSGDL